MCDCFDRAFGHDVHGSDFTTDLTVIAASSSATRRLRFPLKQTRDCFSVAFASTLIVAYSSSSQRSLTEGTCLQTPQHHCSSRTATVSSGPKSSTPGVSAGDELTQLHSPRPTTCLPAKEGSAWRGQKSWVSRRFVTHTLTPEIVRRLIYSGIVSPTDNVLSPCSAKLSGAKQRHFQK